MNTNTPQSSLPKDLAGYQNIRHGHVEPTDLLVATGGGYFWATQLHAGRTILEDGTVNSEIVGDATRVYRKVPTPTQTVDNPQAEELSAMTDWPEPMPDAEEVSTSRVDHEGFVIDEKGENAAFVAALREIDKAVQMPPVDPVGKHTNPKDAIGATKAPLSFMLETGSMFECLAKLEGGLKYGLHNYRAIGVRASIYIDACLRHLMKYWNGEMCDPKTQIPHLTSARACLAIIQDAALMGKLTDDRPPANPALIDELNDMDEHVAHLKSIFADRDPKHWSINDVLP